MGLHINRHRCQQMLMCCLPVASSGTRASSQPQKSSWRAGDLLARFAPGSASTRALGMAVACLLGARHGWQRRVVRLRRRVVRLGRRVVRLGRRVVRRRDVSVGAQASTRCHRGARTTATAVAAGGSRGPTGHRAVSATAGRPVQSRSSCTSSYRPPPPSLPIPGPPAATTRRPVR